MCRSINLFALTLLFVLCCQQQPMLAYRSSAHLPCSFFDTVNITGDFRFANGSFLHEGLVIPPRLIAVYDYIFKDLINREEVEPHLRGCVCHLKPCLNFCCPWGTIFSTNSSKCVNTTEAEWPEPKINITIDNSLVTVDIFEKFVVQSFRPCNIMYSLLPEVNDFDQWQLFENGTLHRLDDRIYLHKHEFCLMPSLINETDTVYVINPANCESQSFSTVKMVNAYAMLFSVPFMLLTILVYLAIPELRNQHGKSLVCYLLGLSFGYTLLAIVTLFTADTTKRGCKIMGYAAYFSFMAAFFWLSVISFDLWHNFRGTRGVNRFQEKRRFLFYSLYAWGSAAVFLLFTWLAQEVIDIPAEYKPGIGDGAYCWLDMTTWSAMIYFFAPILVIIVANIVMFVITALKIHRVQREMARIIAREESNKNLRTEKDKFGLFLRLFIVMGVTWSMEILSYFVGSENSIAKVFYITDICNAIQGFLIFVLFVMKKKVKQLITNRIKRRKSTGTNQTNSTNSTNSGIVQQSNFDAIKMNANIHSNTMNNNNNNNNNDKNNSSNKQKNDVIPKF